MEAIIKDDKVKKEEIAAEVKEQAELEAQEEMLAQFRLSPAYGFIIASIDEKIKSVTDTRILAKNFGGIKSQVLGDIGVLGVASLMAASPLEELRDELTG
jgi:hypothetical protein